MKKRFGILSPKQAEDVGKALTGGVGFIHLHRHVSIVFTVPKRYRKADPEPHVFSWDDIRESKATTEA